MTSVPATTMPAITGAWRRALRDPIVVISLGYLVLLLLVALIAPWITPVDPGEMNVQARLESPSSEYWFGTDALGRDQFSRIIYGSRIALAAAVPTVAAAAALGVAFGLIVGYLGGVVDRVFMRFIDVLDAIPLLLLAIAVVAALGRSLTNAMIGVAVAFSVTYAKLARGQVLVEREREYVDAARVLGVAKPKIMFREILPNAAPPLIIQTSIFLGSALLVEAMLSFLGLGAQAGEPSWGRMLDEARAYQTQQPWLPLFPGLAITITVLMFNLLGDGLRDAFDPGRRASRFKLRGATRATSATGASGSPDPERNTPTPSDGPVLDVEDLRIEFPGATRDTRIPVVRDVTFSIRKGEVFGLVGESGSGKSMTALSLAGLVPSPGAVTGGRIRLYESDLIGLSEREWSEVRGRRIGMIFQNPMAALSPVHTVGRQIIDPLRRHLGLDHAAARTRAIELLRRVGVPDPERRIDDFPFQFSGGMAQRAVIAIALATDPELLIADEPTTALDVTVQEQVLDLLLSLRDEYGMSILLITHDLGVVADTCDRVAVMYAGQIVEVQETAALFAHPRHPYTAALLEAMPHASEAKDRLSTIPGRVAAAWEWPVGCAFAPRCSYAIDACSAEPVEMVDGVRCIRVEELAGTGGP